MQQPERYRLFIKNSLGSLEDVSALKWKTSNSLLMQSEKICLINFAFIDLRKSRELD